MHVKDDFFSTCLFLSGDGKGTKAWEDTWFGKMPKRSNVYSLYNIVQHKDVFIADALS
jgi:hypothetical protein